MSEPKINVSAPRFDLPTVVGLVRRYQALQDLGDWTFDVSIVPGLAHQGVPAWATVDSDVKAKRATVRVRDIRATPMPGFDGDPWHELKVTISHELWHPHVTRLLAEPTVENEERLVEAAAQAVVRSEGAGEDARVMARSIQAIPSAIRARVAQVSARARVRARGGQMDPKMIMEALEALIAGDAEKCQEILKGLIAQAAGGDAGAAEPDGDEGAPPPPAEAAKVGPVPPPEQPGTDSGANARRAKEGDDMADDKARARMAADELEAMVKAHRPAAKEALVGGLRARLGGACTPALEKDIMDAATYADAKQIADFAAKHITASATAQRARSGVEHNANPGVEHGPKILSVDELVNEGHSANWAKGYVQIASRDAAQGAAYLEHGRATLRARKGGTTPQNGVAR